MEIVVMGNGQGYSSEKPALGYPAGRLGPDNRLGLYIGDTWKVLPNLTLNYGLRYVRDTGRTDSDLPGFSQLNDLIPGTGGAVRNPNTNFAPQLGVAWDPSGKGKTVIRAGAGLFYENVIFNNVLFDRPLRLQNGAFLQFPVPCFFGQALPVAIPGGTLAPDPSLCSETVGQAAAGLSAFQAQVQADTPFDLNAPNPNYLLTQLGEGLNLPLGLFAPNYQTPRSLQMNAGVQRELRPGTVLSVDYVRNVTTHTLLGIDSNHVGDARYFNQGAAQAAIDTTLQQCGVTSIDQGIQSCPNFGRSLTIADFAGNGLTSPSVDFGGACPFSYGCAFSGINPSAGSLPFLYPIGRSVYNGMDITLKSDWKSPMKGINRINFQVAYSLSRFTNQGGSNPSTPGNSDQDFVISAIDNRNPLGYSGPSLLDRTSQLSFGGVAELPRGFRASIISHFYSGLSTSLVVPNSGLGAGEIFRTDFTGDGTVQDLLPGTNVGAYNRGVSTGGLAGVIQNYNSTVANNPTPAGQVLVSSGLFTLAQLQALGGVAPTIQMPPAGEVGMGNLRAFDLKLSWVHRFGERVSIEPSIGFYNLFNFANFDLPPNVISGLLTGAPGSINGTTSADRIDNRVGLGTGVFALGAPRAIELGFRIDF
ncbi:MAG TPA: TonB-dependent receptor [Bryobacteraceae bacterium]|nr:TonB-dependent receptor [Bryobacteraceae bacterium]